MIDATLIVNTLYPSPSKAALSDESQVKQRALAIDIERPGRLNLGCRPEGTRPTYPRGPISQSAIRCSAKDEIFDILQQSSERGEDE